MWSITLPSLLAKIQWEAFKFPVSLLFQNREQQQGSPRLRSLYSPYSPFVNTSRDASVPFSGCVFVYLFASLRRSFSIPCGNLSESDQQYLGSPEVQSLDPSCELELKPIFSIYILFSLCQ